MAAKPVVLPEPFSGETSWEDWKLHFEDVAEVNSWSADDKLKWLRVRLTGRAQRAFHRLPTESKATYDAATIAMQQRFEPKSRTTRYQAEFEARRKKPAESWADLGDDLRSLVDKAYPDLQAEARECLALQRYLQQLEQPQVAFGVKQTRPKTVDDAVAATLEMESYTATKPAGVAVLQESVDGEGTQEIAAVTPDPAAKLATMMERLMERVESLEKQHGHQERSREGGRQRPTARPSQQRRRIVCWNCLRPGHIARNCQTSAATKPQGNRSPPA